MGDEPIKHSIKGTAIAAFVLIAWLTGVVVCMGVVDWREGTLLLKALSVPVMSFLFAGLFITSHDSMHGTVAPAWPRINGAIGTTAAFLYSGFIYHKLVSAHHRHHGAPASLSDPDYHDGQSPSFFAWYFRFMRTYASTRLFIFQATVAALALIIFKVRFENYVLGWVVPAIASSLQLFYFGTYLTHREPEDGYDETRAQSNEFGVLLSFISCYHFGYHREHHLDPRVSWWQLPKYRRQLLREGKA